MSFSWPLDPGALVNKKESSDLAQTISLGNLTELPSCLASKVGPTNSAADGFYFEYLPHCIVSTLKILKISFCVPGSQQN